MTKTYRAVIAGTGGVADAHVRAVEATQGRVHLVAAADIDESRVRAFATRNRVAATYTDYATMLRETRPDLVIIASPPATHTAMCVAAMEAGAWVWCEKPLCGSLADFDTLTAAEARTGRFISCVFQMRFASSTAHLRSLAESGQLGRPLVAVCNTLWYRDASYYAVPWRGTWASEFGGPTMGLGIHAMDHLLHLWGDWSEVRAVTATLDRTIQVEDVSAVLITFASRAIATVTNSALSPRQETYIRLDYQKATVELTHLYSYTRENWRFTPAPGGNDESLVRAWESFPPDVGSTHAAQLAEIVSHLDAGTRPLVSGREVRRTLELLSAIYKSAFTGQVVRAGSIQPGDRFYTAVNGGGPAPTGA
ncbi:MAG: Gfo/Idh/MocA family oxidoreductase [Verrucomicrobia bacterium]|nr:Gfo/Idh/MocA family oxidoreductase [Verrucomicrobiota bacterium]